MIGGREVSHLEKGSFVGEVEFLTDKPATATVIAEGDMRALAFDGSELKQFFDKETEVAGLIYQLLGRELANKIKVSNRLLATAKLELIFVGREPVTSEPTRYSIPHCRRIGFQIDDQTRNTNSEFEAAGISAPRPRRLRKGLRSRSTANA